MTNSQPAPRSKRGFVIRQALIYIPLAAVFLALFTIAVVKIATGNPGYVVMLVIGALFGFLFAHQAIQFTLDISAEPVSLEAELLKKWTKGNLLFFLLPSFYISCGSGKIFAISRKDYSGLLETDRVRVLHYPHSLVVERVERWDSTDKDWKPAYSEEEELERLIAAEAERRRPSTR